MLFRRSKKPLEHDPVPETVQGRSVLNYDDLQRSIALVGADWRVVEPLEKALAQIAGFQTVEGAFSLDQAGTNAPQTLGGHLRAAHEDPLAPLRGHDTILFDLLGDVYADLPEAPAKFAFRITYSDAVILGLDPITAVPRLYQHLESASQKVVHVVQRDLVAGAIKALAEKHMPGGDAGASQSVRLNPGDVFDVAQARAAASTATAQQLRRACKSVQTVYLEDLSSTLQAGVLRQLLRFVDHYADLPTEMLDLQQAETVPQVVNEVEIRQHIGMQPPLLSGM